MPPGIVVSVGAGVGGTGVSVGGGTGVLVGGGTGVLVGVGLFGPCCVEVAVGVLGVTRKYLVDVGEATGITTATSLRSPKITHADCKIQYSEVGSGIISLRAELPTNVKQVCPGPNMTLSHVESIFRPMIFN